MMFQLKIGYNKIKEGKQRGKGKQFCWEKNTFFEKRKDSIKYRLSHV